MATIDDNDAAWESALSAYERALTEAREDEPDAGPFPYRFPDDLGPLPPEMAPRAADLVEFAKAVEQGVASAMAKARRDLGDVTRAGRAVRYQEPPAPRYVDTTG